MELDISTDRAEVMLHYCQHLKYKDVTDLGYFEYYACLLLKCSSCNIEMNSSTSSSSDSDIIPYTSYIALFLLFYLNV